MDDLVLDNPLPHLFLRDGAPFKLLFNSSACIVGPIQREILTHRIMALIGHNKRNLRFCKLGHKICADEHLVCMQHQGLEFR